MNINRNREILAEFLLQMNILFSEWTSAPPWHAVLKEFLLVKITDLFLSVDYSSHWHDKKANPHELLYTYHTDEPVVALPENA